MQWKEKRKKRTNQMNVIKRTIIFFICEEKCKFCCGFSTQFLLLLLQRLLLFQMEIEDKCNYNEEMQSASTAKKGDIMKKLK